MTEPLLLNQLFANRVLESYAIEPAEAAPFLSHLLTEAQRGHLFFNVANSPFETLAPNLSPLYTEKGPIVRNGTHYYLRRNWEIETQITEHLHRLSNATRPSFDLPRCPELTPEQQRVLELTSTHTLVLVTGGPGCGKTYTAKQCIHHILEKHPQFRIIATAPTGKAVQCLQSQLPGVKTGTLHALLQLKEHRGVTQEVRPLCADLILVDECSMIDAPLMALLLGAIPTGTTLVLMGDPYQIPPVDIGSVFSDLTTIEALPHAHLNTSHRVKSPALSLLADSIKNRDFAQSLSLLQDPNYPEITLEPLENYRNHCTKSPPPQFLTPFHKGPYGTQHVNAALTECLPSDATVPIMITKNDYSLQLANGTIGILEGTEAHFPTPEGKYRTLAHALLPPYTHAWCLSIHKSQGSEFAHVGVLLPPQSESFGNELLYTAITRAKEHLTLFTTESLLQGCIEAKEQRRSDLKNRYPAL